MVSSLIELCFFSVELLFFFWAWTLSKRALKTILEFHDYLIAYRLTPRSRILRKHLPRMTMVIEEESSMDQSSIMLSQSRLMSVSAKSAARRKFVYNEKTDGEADSPEQPDSGTDSETDSTGDIGGGQEDLERDLAALD